MSISLKADPSGTFGEILINGQVVAKLPVSGNAVIPNLVGTVSQSGGVPTGAVVERGSNANGDYVRFADGTQICTMLFWIAIPAGSGGFSTGEATVPLPAQFVDASYSVSGCQASAHGNSGAAATTFGTGTVRTSSTFYARAASTLTDTAFNVSFRVTAIGRWF